MSTTSDERMSDKEAISVLTEMREEVDFEFRVDRYDSALRIGAAAIAEREELVEALEYATRLTFPDFETVLDPLKDLGPDVTALIKHGRVIRDGETYRWSDRR